MTRPVILHSGSWTDLALEELAPKAADWGYQGLELACWGDHFEVQRAAGEAEYCQQKLELLTRLELTVAVLNQRRVGQAVADPIDRRHQALLPDYVWGDGKPLGVQQRATEEMLATVRAAEKLGAAVIAAGTGSPCWAGISALPPPPHDYLAEGLKAFTRLWSPILDACRDAGIKFAIEIQPGQIAFDLASAEMALEAVNGREELGFAFNPSVLHWQGIDPIEFLRRFPNRIYHVHMKDAALTLHGRSSILSSYLPPGHASRGWEYRSPGHGGIDWEGVIRALNAIGYEGPLSIDWEDPHMDRDFGAEDACKFVKRLDFPAVKPKGSDAFRDS